MRVVRIVGQLVLYPLAHRDTGRLQRFDLGGIVGHQPDGACAQKIKHARGSGKISGFIGEAKTLVRIDRVKPLIL